MVFMSQDAGKHPWHWRPDSDGAEELPTFPTQSDAETWLGESYPELLERGIRAVTLMEDEREVYGPMSLEA